MPGSNEFSITEDQQIMNLAPFYNGVLYSHIEPFLKGSVMEVGSGIGNFTERIMDAKSVSSVTCFEIDKSCCEAFRKRLGPKSTWPKVKLHEYDFNKSDLKERFDFIFSLNVLEHIENDSEAVRKLIEYLKPGCFLFLYLPAMPCIYGSIDRELQHYRRYNKRMLKGLFQGLHVEIMKTRYCNMIGAAGWFYTNRILKRKSQSPGMVSFYDRYIFPFSNYMERFLPNFFGSNIYILARKL